jgi:hypothetical protein
MLNVVQNCFLMMEAVRTFETSVDNYFTPQYIPENNSELHTRRRENLKSHMLNVDSTGSGGEHSILSVDRTGSGCEHSMLSIDSTGSGGEHSMPSVDRTV